MTREQTIINFVEHNSFQNFEGDTDDVVWDFTTREHGNVGDEQFSPIDYKDAHKIGKEVVEKFDEVKDYEVETCDEWVNLYLKF